MSLKEKTLNGMLWSFVENFSKQGINFVIGIILARLLLPEEFGLIGMITIFIAISSSFVNSGFSQALIRKTDCTETDYATVFYFNIGVGVLMALLIFLGAPFIARFFEEPQLEAIVKVCSLLIVIEAFSVIQRTQLTKRIDFKLQTKISVIADVVSGIVAIVLAYFDFGVWSLVIKQLLGRGLNTLLLWFWSSWRPRLIFSKVSFHELFGFGSKLLLSGLISTVFQNIYLLVIGKYFSAAQLGYYTRANQFKQLPSQNISGVIQRVTYPILSECQDDLPKLKSSYQRIIKSTMLITFILMLGLGAIAQPLILVLLGAKWSDSIIYLQLLVFVGMMYPLHSLNLSMLKVQGYSGKFLKLEIIKRTLAIPVIIVGVIYGITWMIVGMMINTIVAFFLNSTWSGKLIGYSSLSQLKDIAPSFVLAASMGILIYYFGIVVDFPPILELLLQLVLGGIYIVILLELIRFKDYLWIKKTITDKIRTRNND